MAEEGIVIKCESCGQSNRIPPEKLGEGPKCGKCHAPLKLPVHPVEITDANFEQEVVKSTVPVCIDFWASWCGPCKAIAPFVEKLAEMHAGKVKFGKLNVDENPLTAAKFDVMSIPTLIIFKGGAEAFRKVGAGDLNDLNAFVARAL
jgi:thioredoxin 2